MPCVPSSQRANAQFLCVGAAIIIAAGIVTSMSRGGWIVATLGSSAAIALALRRAPGRAPALLTRMGTRVLPLMLTGGAIAFALMLYLIGPAVRTQLGERVGATVATAQNLQYKPRVWADTLAMVRHFPLFGVGLGCWPEIFPHYQRPPWSPFFFREAENDYVQFVAETGLTGLALMLWLGLAMGLALWRGGRGMQERSWPLYAALIGGIGAAGLHEAMDFSFHTPANALLFAILAALALRIAFTGGATQGPRMRRAPQTTKRTYLRALAGAGAAAGFIALAYVQDGAAYPYATWQRRGLTAAAAELAAHPAMADTHLMLVVEMPPAASAALRLDQLRAAVWLDPNQPNARDLYAQSLLLAGRPREGLSQVSLAVYRAPQLNKHYYLEPRVIPWLLPAEQEAIVRGFNWAVQARFDYAAKELGSFYVQLGRYRDAGTLELAVAREAADDSERADYLVRAGRDYESAGDVATAARVLKQAAASDPANPQPYAELAKIIYGPVHDFAGADAVIRQGIANGADPYMLEMAVADTTQTAGDHPAAEKALLAAIQYQPTFEAKLRLGEVYMDEGRYDRAALTFQQAADLKPDSAQAYDALGRADEGAYNYFEAAKAYRRATELAPNDQHLRQNYDDFELRTAESAAEAAKAAKGNGHAVTDPAASPVTSRDASGSTDPGSIAPTPDSDSQP
jgi:tetratricopeptide (TPR) repeat protein